ncbi:MAG: SbcC/MukB-like Walker B domain-containing protein, partial [Mycetocola sp.]
QSEVGVAMAAASVAEGIAELVASWTEVGDDAAEPIGDDSAVPEAGDDGASALTPGSHSAAVSASDLDTDEGIRAARERTAAALSLVAESARRHATAETELARCDARAQAIASEMAAVQNDAERAAVRRAEAAERRTSLEARIDRVRAEAGSLAELRTQLRDRRDCLTAHAEASRVVVAARARHTQSSRAVEAALAASDFDTLAEAVASLVSAGVLSELTRLVSEDTTEGAVVAQALADLGDVPEPQDGRVAEAEAATIAASEARDVAVQAAARLDELSGQVADRATRLRADASRAADALQRGRVVTQLSNTVSGRLPNTKRMRLESFVLAGELELIVAAANVRLEVMTSGRFRLVHDDEPGYKNARAGLGLAIEDAHTGRSRSTRSLSGGESFLASLALALGLAEVVTARSGGVRLDTLFIDEGFGSLDAHTLEIAMATLDGLRSGGRTVGVISHVGSMIEQIPATVRVRARPAGDSVIEVSGL